MSIAEAVCPKLLTLKEAAQSLNGRVTEQALRRAARRGQLQIINIAGKFYTTEADLAAFCAASVVNRPMETPPCLARESHPVSTSVTGQVDQLSGSSSTDRARLAQAQARRMLTELRKPSEPISSTDIGRVVPIGRRNSSLRK